MGSNLAKRLKKESLEGRLALLTQNYQGLERDYQEAGDADERNRLQSKLNRKLEEIKEITQEVDKLNQEINNSSIVELINILNNCFDEQRNNILDAYRLSLPNRLIRKEEIPKNAIELINSLQIPQKQNTYSYIDKFVGYFCLLEKTVSFEIKQRLKQWAEVNVNDCQKLVKHLEQELKNRKNKCSPGLLVAISERKGSYVVEAWLNKNITQDEQGLLSNWEQLRINSQAEMSTNETLDNVPNLLKKLIAQSFEKCQKYLKQVHIFLPAKLMNYGIDSWENWQGYEEDNEYTTTIGDEYEVLLRCSERLRGNSPLIINWREKGDILDSKLLQPAEDIFILGNSSNPKSLFKKLKFDEQAIAVKITTVFQQKEPGTLLWKTGLPLALWIRKQLPQIQNQSVLDEVLNCSLKELPSKVRRKRLDAYDHESPENHVGRHLCLLWDDPSILPPEQILTPVNL